MSWCVPPGSSDPSFPSTAIQSSPRCSTVGLCICSHHLLDEVSLFSLMMIFPDTRALCKQDKLQVNDIVLGWCPNPSVRGLAWLYSMTSSGFRTPLLGVFARVTLVESMEFPPHPQNAPPWISGFSPSPSTIPPVFLTPLTPSLPKIFILFPLPREILASPLNLLVT